MNNLVYSFRDSKVRVVMEGNEPLFVASDVCEILEIKSASDALRRLDDDEKGTVSIDTPGGKQNSLVVNEYGLYGLVLGSRNLEAKEFKRWVTHEVLPSIRKTGSFKQDLSANQLTSMLAIELNKEVEVMKKDIFDIKETLDKRMTIDYAQQSVLLNIKLKRAEELHAGNFNDLDKRKMHSNAWSSYKKAFRVASYKDTLISEFGEAKLWLENWRPLI